MKKKVISLLFTTIFVISTLVGCASKETVQSNATEESAKVAADAKDTDAAGTTDSKENEDKATSSDEVIEVNITATIGGFGFYQAIVEANDLSKDLGIKLNWIEGFKSGPEIVAAINGGSVDIGSFGDFPVITSYGSEEGSSFTVVGYTDNITDSALIVKADSDIQNISDLKGKKVGVQIGTGSQSQLLKSLDKGGLSADDIEMVNLDMGSWSSAFAKGDIDAMCVMKLVTIDNKEIGDIRYLDETDYALNSLVANTEWAKQNPEAVAKVLIVLHRALESVANDREAAVKNVLDAYPEASEARVRFTLEATKDTFLVPFGDKPLGRYQDLKDFALKVGSIEKDFDINEVYDNSYIELANNLIKDYE